MVSALGIQWVGKVGGNSDKSVIVILAWLYDKTLTLCNDDSIRLIIYCGIFRT